MSTHDAFFFEKLNNLFCVLEAADFFEKNFDCAVNLLSEAQKNFEKVSEKNAENYSLLLMLATQQTQSLINEWNSHFLKKMQSNNTQKLLFSSYKTYNE